MRRSDFREGHRQRDGIRETDSPGKWNHELESPPHCRVQGASGGLGQQGGGLLRGFDLPGEQHRRRNLLGGQATWRGQLDAGIRCRAPPQIPTQPHHLRPARQTLADGGGEGDAAGEQARQQHVAAQVPGVAQRFQIQLFVLFQGNPQGLQLCPDVCPQRRDGRAGSHPAGTIPDQHLLQGLGHHPAPPQHLPLGQHRGGRLDELPARRGGQTPQGRQVEGHPRGLGRLPGPGGMPGGAQPPGDLRDQSGGLVTEPIRGQLRGENHLLPTGITDTGRITRTGIQLGEGVAHQATRHIGTVDGIERAGFRGQQGGGVERTDHRRHPAARRQFPTQHPVHSFLAGLGVGVDPALRLPECPAVGQRRDPQLLRCGAGCGGFDEPVPGLLGVIRPGPREQGIAPPGIAGEILGCLLGFRDGDRQVQTDHRHRVGPRPAQRHQLRGEVRERVETEVPVPAEGHGQRRGGLGMGEPVQPFGGLRGQLDGQHVWGEPLQQAGGGHRHGGRVVPDPDQERSPAACQLRDLGFRGHASSTCRCSQSCTHVWRPSAARRFTTESQ